jgi:hypothetical protein
MGGNPAPYGGPIGAHGPHSSRRARVGSVNSMGTFNLLNYNPALCKLFAFPLSDGVIMIHMTGLFGWIGMSHAFQVLTRSLQALCSHIIIGLCYWYVDDLMAVSSISSYLTDSTHVDNSVQHLLGDGSIAKQKSQCARQYEDNYFMREKFAQISSRLVLLRYRQKGINSADPTNSITGFPHISPQ